MERRKELPEEEIRQVFVTFCEKQKEFFESHPEEEANSFFEVIYRKRVVLRYKNMLTLTERAFEDLKRIAFVGIKDLSEFSVKRCWFN